MSRRCIIKFILSYLTLLLIHSKILLLIFRFATVAHLAEQHIRNVQVAGSIPASGSRSSLPDPETGKLLFFFHYPGALAQLGARMTGSHEVRGSIPLCSTRRTTSIPDSACCFVIHCIWGVCCRQPDNHEKYREK